MDTCKCGHNRSQHARGFMGDVLLAEGRFMCGMCDCPCRDFEVIELTNNEQNKLLAALVGDCYRERDDTFPFTCTKCDIPHHNTDYFADPPHSKIVKLVGKAVEKWGYEAYDAGIHRALWETFYTPEPGHKLRSVEIAAISDELQKWRDRLPADRIASAIVNLIKEQDGK